MSMLQFIHTPFPDNHNGFDYSPKSFMDVQHEVESAVQQKRNAEQENKMKSMLASIMK